MGLFDLFSGRGGVRVLSPAAGEALPLSSCSDPVFAQGMMGRGVVLLPSEGRLCSPVDGSVEVVFDTLHAIGIRSDSGLDVMLHVGIDTVELNAAPFVAHVRVGDHVRAGQPLLDADLDAIRKAGKSTETVVTVTDADDRQVSDFASGSLRRGDVLFSVR